MLAHFNYVNTGFKLFLLARERDTRREMAVAAGLSDEQANFVCETAERVRKQSKYRHKFCGFVQMKDLLTAAGPLMKQVRKEEDFAHPYYWISQLFDEEWKPSTAG